MNNTIDQEVDAQKARMASAYQKRAEADDQIQQARTVIQALEFAKRSAESDAPEEKSVEGNDAAQ